MQPMDVQREQTALRFEIEQPEEYGQYLLHANVEILAVLRSLVAKRSLISAYYHQGASFLLTSLLEVDARAEQIVLDWGREEAGNQQALQASPLVLTATVDKVKIQFLLDHLTEAQHAGRKAFRAALPKAVLRLQRREFFRLATPIARPVKFVTTVKRPDGSAMVVEASLFDISAGGVGLIATPTLASLLPRGTVLTDCKIPIPDEGLLIANLCVRNRSEITTRGGSRHVRVGCEFIALPGSRMSMVQRYITRVERERKARMSGML